MLEKCGGEEIWPRNCYLYKHNVDIRNLDFHLFDDAHVTLVTLPLLRLCFTEPSAAFVSMANQKSVDA